MKYIFVLLFITTIFIIGCGPKANTEEIDEITYIDTGAYGVNLLDIYATNYIGNDFSFSAKIPDAATLQIVLQKNGAGSWFLEEVTNTNWTISNYNFSTGTQTFTASGDEITTDLHIEIYPGTYTILYYENGDTSPTRTREIEI